MSKSLITLALLTLCLLGGCAQMEKEMGTAIEDGTESARTLPENIWK